MAFEELTIRESTAGDTKILSLAALEAMNWNGEDRFTYEQLMSKPELSHYLTGWPRAGDFGVIAETKKDVAVGAAWCRTFAADDAGYGFVDVDVPELTVGVFPGHRGVGVGSALIKSLIAHGAARGCRAISLSVEDGNRARALYDRLGFVNVGRNGGSDTLLLEL
ncbi:GNAT family N-acetyltransferase [Arthrobacter sp. H14]|uniref:GNAT family N-acetyltransferase n=1 Tax=Arthrobacter sp. H14 TaxID=1312959 RepID=UPI00047DED64|nr:GNAT family N-acetyltransferase [Arthrobacter sp. H14]